jgi:hypothetical protein
MTDPDTSRNQPPLPGSGEFAKSIFPTFNVRVPMPADTAVPGSYNKPTQTSASPTPAPKPATAAE